MTLLKLSIKFRLSVSYLNLNESNILMVVFFLTKYWGRSTSRFEISFKLYNTIMPSPSLEHLMEQALALTCSKLTMVTPEKYVKSVEN